MDSAAVDPTVTLLVALITAAGLIVGPVLVALINRSGGARQSSPPPPSVDLAADLDALNDRLARENERLARENARLREQLEHERAVHAREIARRSL